MADAEGVEDGPDDAYSNAGEADDEERKSVDYKDSNLKQSLKSSSSTLATLQTKLTRSYTPTWVWAISCICWLATLLTATLVAIG
jgi:hypothetical protein